MITSTQSMSFGIDGHVITAHIAENHLSENTRLEIGRISDGKSLTALALWPDQIRSAAQWRHSKPWHYINIDDGEIFPTLRRSKRGDVLSALENAYQELKNDSLSLSKRRQALAFFIHFAGDIHQPLHVCRSSDLGGNRVDVQWLNKKAKRNLHWVWDTGLIKHQQLSAANYSKSLDDTTPQQRHNWQSDRFVAWAQESKALRSQVYEFGYKTQPGTVAITEHYVARNTPLVEKRLLMAGIRIAGCLNKLFDTQDQAKLKTNKNSCATAENLE